MEKQLGINLDEQRRRREGLRLQQAVLGAWQQQQRTANGDNAFSKTSKAQEKLSSSSKRRRRMRMRLR